MKAKTAILGLRILTLVVMAVGVGGVTDGFVNHRTIPLFAFDVPTWVIGGSAFYMGLKYWRRIPELERKVHYSAGFSWSNFSWKRLMSR